MVIGRPGLEWAAVIGCRGGAGCGGDVVLQVAVAQVPAERVLLGVSHPLPLPVLQPGSWVPANAKQPCAHKGRRLSCLSERRTSIFTLLFCRVNNHKALCVVTADAVVCCGMRHKTSCFISEYYSAAARAVKPIKSC